MTLFIIGIILLGFVLIATSQVTNVNRAAAAIMAGTVGWVLYICYGADFVMSEHADDYVDFLSGAVTTSSAVKDYVAENIFINYVSRGAELVIFLLATMTIVEILDNNGCFDFFRKWALTRKSRKLLWIFSTIAFLVSANIDNLTVATMMLVLMREMVPSRRHRMLYGAAIIIAANCGGALTVIGDPIGLLLWSTGHVSATNFSASLAIPCLLGWIIPTCWIAYQLPERIDLQSVQMPYRGDDTNLNVWQRLLMLFVGIGGLWFIPSFHAITHLSPFLGSLCVLSVLWIVNEVMNRKLMNADQMSQRRIPRVLQYGVMQLMLYVMGIILAVGVVQETGAIGWLTRQFSSYIDNVWFMGTLTAMFSCVLDSFATSVTFFSMHETQQVVSTFGENHIFWKVVAYSSAMGGNVLLLGSVSGLALIKMERIHVWWYFRNVGWTVIVAWLLGIVSMYLFNYFG